MKECRRIRAGLLVSALLVSFCMAPVVHARKGASIDGPLPPGNTVKPEDCEIVFIGDSITFGWTATNLGQTVWEKKFVPLKAINAGICAATTDSILAWLDKGKLDPMKKLKLIVLHIGTNDIGLAKRAPPAVAEGVQKVVDKLKEKAPKAQILVMGITPKGRGGVNESNDLIAKLDDGKTVFYKNINKSMTPDCIADRVGHLTAKGFEVWGEEIYPTVQKLIKK